MNWREHLQHHLDTDPEFRAHWEAHHDCREREKSLLRRMLRFIRLRDGYKAQRDRYREALKRYGAHNYDCDKIDLDGAPRSGDWPCTCGLDDALNQ